MRRFRSKALVQRPPTELSSQNINSLKHVEKAMLCIRTGAPHSHKHSTPQVRAASRALRRRFPKSRSPALTQKRMVSSAQLARRRGSHRPHGGAVGSTAMSPGAPDQQQARGAWRRAPPASLSACSLDASSANSRFTSSVRYKTQKHQNFLDNFTDH